MQSAMERRRTKTKESPELPNDRKKTNCKIKRDYNYTQRLHNFNCTQMFSQQSKLKTIQSRIQDIIFHLFPEISQKPDKQGIDEEGKKSD